MTDKGRYQLRSATSLVDRRQFLRQTAAGAALPAALGMLGGSAHAQAKTVNVASYGGVVQDYQTRLFAQPFEAKTGIEVNIGSMPRSRWSSCRTRPGQRPSGTSARSVAPSTPKRSRKS